MKNTTLPKYIGSLLAVALLASVHVASAIQVNVLLTSVDDPASDPDGNYWNVLEFEGAGRPSVSDALDTSSNCTGITVSAYGEEYDGWETYCSENGGGTITFEIDLPAGTFDITPGFSGPGSDTATITDDIFTGITGPTTVYLSFLNNGYPITTAGTIVINQY